MRSLALFVLMLLLLPSAAFAQQANPSSNSTVTPRSVSAGPTPLAGGLPGARGSATAAVLAQGTPVDVQAYQHWAGNDAVVERFTTFVARDSEEWRLLWLRLGRDPPVTFPRDKIAIAIMIGPRPSEGYNVRVTEMRLADSALYVTYLESKPSTARPSGLQKSNPWLIKFAPAVSGRVRFLAAQAGR